MSKSNAQLERENGELREELKALNEQLSGVDLAAMRHTIQTLTGENAELKANLVSAAAKIEELKSAPKPAVQGHNVDREALRVLTAICLMSSKDPSGRAHNVPTMEKLGPDMVAVARMMAMEIVSQIP